MQRGQGQRGVLRHLKKLQTIRLGFTFVAQTAFILCSLPLWELSISSLARWPRLPSVGAIFFHLMRGILFSIVISIAVLSRYQMMSVQRRVYPKLIQFLRFFGSSSTALLILMHTLSGVICAIIFRFESFVTRLPSEDEFEDRSYRPRVNERLLVEALAGAIAGFTSAILFVRNEEYVVSFPLVQMNVFVSMKERVPSILLKGVRRGFFSAILVLALYSVFGIDIAQNFCRTYSWWTRRPILPLEGSEQGSFTHLLLFGAQATLFSTMLHFYLCFCYDILMAMLTKAVDFDAFTQWLPPHRGHPSSWLSYLFPALALVDGQGIEDDFLRDPTLGSLGSKSSMPQDRFQMCYGWEENVTIFKRRFQNVLTNLADSKSPRVTKRQPFWAALSRALAFYDLQTISQFDYTRRMDIFADETGEAWMQVVKHCTAAVDAVTLKLRLATAASETAAQSSKPDLSKLRPKQPTDFVWLAQQVVSQSNKSSSQPLDKLRNAFTEPEFGDLFRQLDDVDIRRLEGTQLRQGLQKLVTNLVSKPLRLSAKERTRALFADAQVTIWSIDAISTLLAKSYAEDSTGFAQDTIPVVLNSLLACHFAIQEYIRSPAFFMSLAPPSELRGHRLIRIQPQIVTLALDRGIYRIVLAFKDHLHHYRFPSKYSAKLQSYMEFKE